jgi:hypothetical protein
MPVPPEPLKQFVGFDFQRRNKRPENEQRGEDADRTDDPEVLQRANRTREVREKANRCSRSHPHKRHADTTQREGHRGADVVGAVVGVALLALAHEHVDSIVN